MRGAFYNLVNFINTTSINDAVSYTHLDVYKRQRLYKRNYSKQFFNINNKKPSSKGFK